MSVTTAMRFAHHTLRQEPVPDGYVPRLVDALTEDAPPAYRPRRTLADSPAGAPAPEDRGRRGYSRRERDVPVEQLVVRELERLVAIDPRWAYLNSIPVGVNTSEIDHLVAGPGGVFTINARHHHTGSVPLGGDAWLAEGRWQHYVHTTHREAERASTLLSNAARTTVAVRGVVVPVGTAQPVMKEQPTDVDAVAGADLVGFFLDQPPVLDAYTVALILTCARLTSTWAQNVAR